MPNDAKLGLLCGVGVVIAISVVFFRNEGSSASPAGNATARHSPTQGQADCGGKLASPRGEKRRGCRIKVANSRRRMAGQAYTRPTLSR
jgi:hypothetical protein